MASKSARTNAERGRPKPASFPRTDEDKLEWLKRGWPLHFPAVADGGRADELREVRTIRASWLAQLVRRPGRLCELPVGIKNAIIVGPLDLQYATFQYEFSVTDSTFADTVNFSFAAFKRSAVFAGCRFLRPARFRAARTEFDFDIKSARFSGAAVCTDLHVGALLLAQGAWFGSANFERLTVAKSAFFKTDVVGGKAVRSRFWGEANFRDADVQGNAHFDAAQFRAAAIFSRMRVGGNAFFGAHTSDRMTLLTSFAGGASFAGSQFRNHAYFGGVQFKGRADFGAAKFSGDVSFLPVPLGGKLIPAYFGAEAFFTGAQVGGSAKFQGCRFKKRAEFERLQVGGVAFFRAHTQKRQLVATRFHKSARFMGAAFGVAADFCGAQFLRDANFRFVRIGGDGYFRAVYLRQEEAPTLFHGKADFSGAEIRGSVEFDSAWFVGDADFERLSVGGKARFRTASGRRNASPITFGGATRFVHMNVAGTAEFHGAYFGGRADFGRAQIGGSAFFDPADKRTRATSVCFAAEVKFVDAHVKGTVSFQGAQFLGEAVFSRLKVDGDAFFSSVEAGGQVAVTNFCGQSRFIQAHVQGAAHFYGAQFKRAADFGRIQIDGSAGFSPLVSRRNLIQTSFQDEVKFQSSRIKGLADFGGVNFGRGASFEGVRIDSTALFRAHADGPLYVPIVFHGEARFLDANVQGSVEFNGAQFNRGLNFARAKVDGNVFFNPRGAPVKFGGHSGFVGTHFASQVEFDRAQFRGSMDLRGFTYARIEADHKDLLENLAASAHYDRQPYTQLEKVYRSIGYDRRADEVYLARRRHERKRFAASVARRKGAARVASREALQDLGRVSWDYVQWGLWNYGVRPYMLLVASFIVLLAGTYIFTFPGAAVPKDPKSRTAQDARLQQPMPSAFNISLHQFIPIIEIPPGREWVPSDYPAPLLGRLNVSFAGYATLHRLLGALLVPLGVAAVTGLLIRREKN